MFKILGTIAIDNSNANKSINETSGIADKAKSAMSASFSAIGSAAVAVGKAIAAGLAVGSAAMGALMKSSIENYADYEQLIGGVETLFGTSAESAAEFVKSAREMGKSAQEALKEFSELPSAADTVIQYAAEAYKTAGLSANEYMETVTSFSASLLQSVGGDTVKAAEIANMAITDMSDNANKMGSDMSTIQNAYQGFAKQNYTMLDNLKLGYGGTKEEMQRLLEDATALSGVEYNLESYADVVDAIHVIQDEMGITGTTAKEASTTISGSIATMKAAWTNFLTGMADDTQDFDSLLGNVVDSVVTVVGNLIPRIQILLPRLIEGLTLLTESLIPEIPGLVTAILPGILEGAVALLGGLIEALPTLVGTLMSALQQSTDGALGGIVDSVLSIVPHVMLAFQQLLPLGAQMVGVVSQIFPLLAPIINQVLPIVVDLINLLLPPLMQVVSALLPPLIQMLTPLLSLLSPIIQLLRPILDLVTGILAPISTLISELLTPLISVITSLINVALVPMQFQFELISAHLQDTVCAAVDWVMNRFNLMKANFEEIISFIRNVFTGNWQAAWQNVKNIFSNIADGIGNAFKAPINYIIDLINNFLEGLNGITIPDWVPGVGGQGFSIPLIPKLEKGGILEKGKIGFLEGTGAEAVVPLDQNRAWISKVAEDMNLAVGGANNQQVQELKEAFQAFVRELPEMLTDAFESMTFDINNREFARLVKAVN